MAELLASKVVVVEEEPKVRGIPSLSTSVAGAVGITERGPIGVPVVVTSFDEFEATFGGFRNDADLALAAAGFFENGGSRLWVVRTCHYSDITQPSSATAIAASGQLPVSSAGPSSPVVLVADIGPYKVQPGEALQMVVNGGLIQSMPFVGTTAELTSADGPFELVDGDTLLVRIDGRPEQTITFSTADFVDIAAATAVEIANVISQQLTDGSAYPATDAVLITRKVVGSAVRLEVTGGSAASVLQFPAGEVAGTGTFGNFDAISVVELIAALAPLWPDLVFSATGDGRLQLATLATGPGASVWIEATPVPGELGLPTGLFVGTASTPGYLPVTAREPGAWGNRLQFGMLPSTPLTFDTFDCGVARDGQIVERFPNVSFNPSAPRYFRKVVNDPRLGSKLVTLPESSVAPVNPVTAPIITSLSGGSDGVVGLTDIHFVGSEAGRTGLRALDAVQDLTLLLVPGRASAGIHEAMLQYAEVTRGGTVFAVLDPPAGLSASAIVDYVRNTSLEGSSEFGAIYWPRVKVLNPSRSVFGTSETIVVPPSGIVAGVFARADAARPGGVYDPPAGIEKGRMFGVLGFETDEVLDERKRDLVYPHRINPLTTGPGLPRFIDGSRTLKGDGNFPFVAERRGVSYIERSLHQGLQFARHRNNTEALRAQVRRTIVAFLLQQMNQGAFRSNDPQKAFFVDVSDTLNPPSVVMAGQLIIRVGLATNKPAEFIILRIAADTRALDAELAAASN